MQTYPCKIAQGDRQNTVTLTKKNTKNITNIAHHYLHWPYIIIVIYHYHYYYYRYLNNSLKLLKCISWNKARHMRMKVSIDRHGNAITNCWSCGYLLVLIYTKCVQIAFVASNIWVLYFKRKCTYMYQVILFQWVYWNPTEYHAMLPLDYDMF